MDGKQSAPSFQKKVLRIHTCSYCGGQMKRDEKLGMNVCQNCGKVKHYVFISYSSRDQYAADYIMHVFTENGIPVWMAPYDIPVGEKYPRAISDAVDNCSALVLLLTEDSQNSEHVNNEVAIAFDKHKPLLPVQLDKLELNGDFSYYLRTNHIMELPAVDIRVPQFQQLISRVKGLVDMDPIQPPVSGEDGGYSGGGEPPKQESPLPAWLRKNWKTCTVGLAALVLVAGLAFAFGKGAGRDDITPQETAGTASGQTEEAKPEAQTAAPSTAVDSIQPGDWRENVLAFNEYDDQQEENPVYGLGITRSQVSRVTFLDSTAGAPETAQDVSGDQNGSVLAWIVPDGDLYELCIAANGGINAKDATGRMFWKYTNLEEIRFNDAFHTDEATDMHAMFTYCDQLKEVDVSGFRTAQVTSMSCMFYGCSSLTTLDLQHFDTSKVTDMYAMFYQCSGLSALDVQKFNTSKVTNMRSMFRDCSALTSLELQEFNTSAVKNMDYMFGGCAALESLDLRQFNTARVESMEGMFYGCGNLRSLELNADKFDTSSVKNMRRMFSLCSMLGSLDLQNFSTDRVEDMSSMFNSCSGLEEIKLDPEKFDTSNVKTMNRMFLNCSSLKSLDVQRFDTSQAEDMFGMFSGCALLKTLDVSGFRTAQVKDMSYMFSGCKNLTELNVKNFDTSRVESMISMFGGCRKIKHLDVSNFRTENVKDMNTMFYDCCSLESLNLAGFDTAMVTNMSHMLAKCTDLADLDLGTWETDNVTEYASFMDAGKTYQGRNWESLFPG